MKIFTITSLALACSAGAAFGQSYPTPDAYQPAPSDNPNVQSYQDYQGAMSAYDAARDAAARENDDFQARSVQYEADRRAFHHQLRAYERARDDYDAQYGPGAYETYYAPPAPPPPPY